jgi:uncharacterized protein (TIGR02246 family)
MSNSSQETAVRSLFNQFINHWNHRDAKNYASLLTPDASVIGFDGSQMNGAGEAEKELERIFSHHPTAAYVTIEKELRFLSADVALLRTVAGMVPPGASDIKPEVNSIQTMIATRNEGDWRIALFQNTPAAFHGRPELTQQLTDQLRSQLKKNQIA